MIWVKRNSFLLLLVGALALSACSTKKNTFVTRSYHNINSKFNGLFYAKENLRAGKLKLEKGHIDNYTEVLTIYRHGDERLAQSIYPEMDKAIEKASKVIQRHSIYLKKKEYCKWIDDAYLLIGKANFYKKDFPKAIEMFEYVAKEFKESDIRHEAKLWLYKTYVEQERYDKANHIYTLIEQEDSEEMPEEILLEAKKVRAFKLMRQNDQGKATEYIKEVIEGTKKKRSRARLTFILAQLSQNKNNFFRATDLYDEVINISPDYEMVFNAKLNKAMCSLGDSDDFDKVISPLKKMLNDDKNKEFKDKIYFVLAEIYKEKGDMPTAIENYKLSISSSVGDKNQQAMSYLALAEYYYDRPNYQLSKCYYDSTISVLAKTYGNYDEVHHRKVNLKGLVKNLNIIAMEDSLLRFAMMSPKKRDLIIQGLISDAVAAEEKKKEDDEIKKQEKY